MRSRSSDHLGPPSREAELLLRCSRLRLEPEDQQRIRDLAASGVDWDTVVRLAEQHRVVPLLSRHINDTCPGDLPTEVAVRLRSATTEIAKHSLFLTRELREIFDLFGAAGIPMVPYKGPVLAQQVYDSVALRSMGDLDVLVPREHVARAREILEARGYLQPEPLTAVQQQVALRTECNCAFVRPGPHWITLELHWAFATGRSSFPLTLAELQTRLTTVRLAGAEFPAVRPEDLLLILCYHGSKHMWERLEWICGVAELIRKESVDWDETLRRSERLGSRRMLLLGAGLAHRLLGTPLPISMSRRIEADRVVEKLIRETQERLFSGDVALAHSIGWPFHRYQLRVKERVRDRARYLYFSTLAPAREDWRAVPLPRLLFPLYLLIRPVRLAGEYGLRLARSA